MKTTVSCPQCKQPVLWSEQEKFKPFCSERCRLIDLGEWIMEEKIIPGQQTGFDDEFNQ